MDRESVAGVSAEVRAVLARSLPAYEIEAVLGSGAFGVVYAAQHVGLRREVAIKRLAPELLRDPDARERFAVEARLLASLDHPHIVRVYDYVESESVCALVMERMHGGTLSERVRVNRPSPATACAITLGVLSGLEHAHQRGVLHRDVKPDNLLFDTGERVKVADFGIAKVIVAAGARLTATAGTLGTPAYMAPEQVRRTAGPLSRATDVWAAGAVLYELLAGETPFPREPDADLAEVLVLRVTEDPRPLREAAPAVPAEIEAVVMQSLRRDLGQRFQTAAAFSDALERAVGAGFGRGALAATGIPIHRADRAPAGGTTLVDAGDPLPPPAGDPAPPAGDGPPPPAGDGPPPPRPPRRHALPGSPRRRAGAVAVAMAAVAVAAVLAFALSAGPGTSGASALSNLPAPPTGWPSRLAFGPLDTVRTPSQMAAHFGKGGIDYMILAGDAQAKMDWSHTGSVSPRTFVEQAHAAGLFPYLSYYEARAIGFKGGDANTVQLKETLANPKLMRIYWENARKLMIELGQAGGPVALSLEPSVFALLEQDLGFNSNQPSDLAVSVASSGMPEFKGLSDNLNGFTDGWFTLRNRYAPHVILGAEIEFFGTNLDLAKTHPDHQTLVNAASRQARFFLDIGGNITLGHYEFAGFGNPYAEQGKDPTAPYGTDAEKALWINWIKAFVKVAQVRVTLEGVPQGNTVMKTIDDKPYHWHDHWVQWLIGDSKFTNLRKLRDAGVIGLQFTGIGGPDETCPCDAARDGVTNGGTTGIVSHSADDDGGYMAARIAAVRAAGGLALQ